ncbi:MAG TPA: hypothetical protein VFT93_07310, partial [Candidatus Eisenbacteria bacterium]|nr:hypothetical protein [Candidatus Eisenbacteria bacterium]
CIPRAPRCEACPAATRCLARRSGDPAAYPEPAKTGSGLRTRRIVMLLARRGAKILLLNGEAAGNAAEPKAWSLPLMETKTATSRSAAVRLSRTWTKGSPVEGPTRRFRHRTYAEDLHFEVWESLCPPPERSAGKAATALKSEVRWVDPTRLDELPLRSPTLKAVKGLRRSPKLP